MHLANLKIVIRNSFFKNMIFILGVLFSFTQLYAENSNSFTFEKCSRLNIGAGYSSYNFEGRQYSTPFYIQHNYCLKPTPHFGFGIGAGLTRYKEQTFIPVYFDFLACHRNNFYANLQAGYSFGWKSKPEYYPNYSLNGGLYSQIGVGYKFKLFEDFNSCLFLGYNHQSAGLESQQYPEDKLLFNSVVLTLGILLERK